MGKIVKKQKRYLFLQEAMPCFIPIQKIESFPGSPMMDPMIQTYSRNISDMDMKNVPPLPSNLLRRHGERLSPTKTFPLSHGILANQAVEPFPPKNTVRVEKPMEHSLQVRLVQIFPTSNLWVIQEVKEKHS